MRLAVRALAGLLARSPPPRLQAAAAQALCSVVRVDRLAAEVVDAGFFPVAQRLLRQSEQVPQRILLRCLSCVLSFHATSHVEFARRGGAHVPVSGLLWWYETAPGGNSERLSVDERSPASAPITDGKVEYLVEAISLGNLASRTRAAQAAGMLGASSVGRSSPVAMGAPLALVGLLKDGDSSAKLVAANAFGIVSSSGLNILLIHQLCAIPLLYMLSC